MIVTGSAAYANGHIIRFPTFKRDQVIKLILMLSKPLVNMSFPRLLLRIIGLSLFVLHD